MKGLVRFVVLFAYFQLKKKVINCSEPNPEKVSISSTTSSGSSNFDSVRDSLKVYIAYIDEEVVENAEQNNEITLDLSDIDLDLFIVKDDYYRGYTSKIIELKGTIKKVKIMDGNTVIHEHVTDEKFVQCTLNSNKNYTYIEYNYSGARLRLYSMIYYKRNGEWIVADEDLITELEKSDGEICDLDLGGDCPEDQVSKFSDSIQELCIRFNLDINTKKENDNFDFREGHIEDIRSLVYKTMIEIGTDSTESLVESDDEDSLKGSIKLAGSIDLHSPQEDLQFDLIDTELSITSVESVFSAIGAIEDTQSLISSEDVFQQDMENYTSSVLNIIDINFNYYNFSDNIYKNFLHRAVEVNYGHKVTEVVEGKVPIHKLKGDENVFRCLIYHKDRVPELVDIFIQDKYKRLTYYIYAKREGEWVMTYFKRSDIMYRLYRYMSRPIKKFVNLELEDKDEEDFE